MANFDFDKKGYNVEQVDKFINSLTLKYEEKLSEQKDRVFSLKQENSMLKERLETYEQKDKQISQALIFAVEKAEQIETSARKIYDLEVRRIRLLYNKWQELLEKTEEYAPNLLVNGKLQLEFNEFSDNISTIIKQNEKFDKNGGVKEDLKKNSDNYIKNLLNKMDYIINDKRQRKEFSLKDVEKTVLNQKINNEKLKKSLHNNIINKTAEDFMNENTLEINNAYAKNLTQQEIQENDESGFNMEDIINPKEELDEIMKAFDFYTGE